MDSHDIKNGTKILINNRIYTVVAVVMHTVYVKYTLSCNDFDYTEDEIVKKYKIEFINQKEK